MHQIEHNDLKYAKERGFNPVGWVPCPRGEQGKINPQVTQMYDGEKFFSVFHVKPVYYETLTGDWRPLSEVTSHHGNHRIVFTLDGFKKVHPRYINWLQKRMDLIDGQLSVGSVTISPYIQYIHDTVTVPKIGCTVTTVYPDPHTETTTVDGYVTRLDEASWTSARDNATAEFVADNGAAQYLRHDKDGSVYSVDRHIHLFDTSSIPDTDTISAATESIYCAVDQSGNGNMGVGQCTPASNTSLVAGDFDCMTVNSMTEATDSRVDCSTLGQYNDFVFNSTGIGWIDKTGVTKLCLRGALDIDDSAPTARNYVYFYFADQSGTSNDPKLAVTHAAAATFTPKVSWFM